MPTSPKTDWELISYGNSVLKCRQRIREAPTAGTHVNRQLRSTGRRKVDSAFHPGFGLYCRRFGMRPDSAGGRPVFSDGRTTGIGFRLSRDPASKRNSGTGAGREQIAAVTAEMQAFPPFGTRWRDNCLFAQCALRVCLRFRGPDRTDARQRRETRAHKLESRAW